MVEVNKMNSFSEIMRKYFKISLFKIKPSRGSKEKARIPEDDESGSEDVVSKIIGEYGRWQLLMTALLSLFSFPCTFHIYLPTFTAYATKFWCQRPENLSDLPIESWIKYSQPVNACYVRVLTPTDTAENIMNETASYLDAFEKCQVWDFDRSDVGNTIISEWGLVCDRASLTNLAEVVFLIGVGIGGVVGGWISDKYGRKRILMAMAITQSILAIISLLVQTYVQYVVLRLIMGLVSVSVVYAAFVLSVELVGGKWVTIAGVCNFFPLPLAYIIVSLLSIALPNWRELQLALSIPGCLLVFLWFVLPESPRWLLSMGRIKEAKEILERVAKFNKREVPADIDKLLHVYVTDVKTEDPSVCMLLRGYLLKRTTCLAITWFAMTLGYYGLLLNIGNFNLGNIHLTSIILAAVEIPAIAISIPILLKAGRRLPIFTTMTICGLACVGSELLTMFFENEWVIISCLMVGKFAIAATNMMLPIFTAELYPTVVRNLGVGASQISAGLSLICIPYLWELTTFNDHLPMITIALMTVAGGAVVLSLPDTAEHKKQRTAGVNDVPQPNENHSPSDDKEN
ncbi:organic cation transporter protein-like isoform X2 [Leptidea sinapis]|uniref:organic cation transporter protein-like isoform X2 n=1 Tax=Leptidea sinapis TaxID=189913 RepID=UPI00212B43C1|nr:organic cation transporter protein-like isoform X2 [Leptidea sinapis]